MGHVGVAGLAELVAVTLEGDFIGAANDPRIFGRAVLTKLGEELLKPRIQLPLGALTVKMQGKIAGTRHRNSVRPRRKKGESSVWRANSQKKGAGRAPPRRNLLLEIQPDQEGCGAGCDARFCLISLTLSTRSSACFSSSAR